MLDASPVADAPLEDALAIWRIHKDLDGPRPPQNPLARLQGLTIARTDDGAVDVADAPGAIREKAKAAKIRKLERFKELAQMLGHTDVVASMTRQITVLRKPDAGPRKATRYRWR